MLKNVKVLIQICFIRYNNYIFVHIIETLIFKLFIMTTIKHLYNYEVTKNNIFVAGFGTFDQCEAFVKQKDSTYNAFQNNSDLGYSISHEIHY